MFHLQQKSLNQKSETKSDQVDFSSQVSNCCPDPGILKKRLDHATKENINLTRELKILKTKYQEKSIDIPVRVSESKSFINLRSSKNEIYDQRVDRKNERLNKGKDRI